MDGAEPGTGPVSTFFYVATRGPCGVRAGPGYSEDTFDGEFRRCGHVVGRGAAAESTFAPHRP